MKVGIEHQGAELSQPSLAGECVSPNSYVKYEIPNGNGANLNGASAANEYSNKQGAVKSKMLTENELPPSNGAANSRNNLSLDNQSINADLSAESLETSPSIVDVIKKKRDRKEWSRQDVKCFVQGATYGRITEAQIGAGLMAICLNGMTDRETSDLTQEMINTGARIPRPSHWPPGSVVGKHSTGGVGDKVTIALSPALAACGLKVPKLSGRGLGHTGGTLDKLESIPGFRVQYGTDEVIKLVDRAGCCIVGVSEKLSPADKILYAIRDTTGTTESLPLVAGSVMCKKAAESLDSLSLEVTYGKAALIKTREEAVRLSRLMIETGRALNISTSAVLVRMDNVLGKAVGNSLEIEEAVECMHGRGPSDVIDVCCALGSYLLVQAGVVNTAEEGREMIKLRLEDGSAAIKFYEMMVAQGVDETVARQVARLDLLDNRCHSNQDPSNCTDNETSSQCSSSISSSSANSNSRSSANSCNCTSINNNNNSNNNSSNNSNSSNSKGNSARNGTISDQYENSNNVISVSHDFHINSLSAQSDHNHDSKSNVSDEVDNKSFNNINCSSRADPERQINSKKAAESGTDGTASKTEISNKDIRDSLRNRKNIPMDKSTSMELQINGAMRTKTCANDVLKPNPETLSNGGTESNILPNGSNHVDCKAATSNGVVDREDRSATNSRGDEMEREQTVLPRATNITKLMCQKSGYISAVDAYTCGHVVRNLGAGRSRPGDIIDYSAGLRLLVDLGQHVNTGEPWVEIHHNRSLTMEMMEELQSALITSQQPVQLISVIDSLME